MAESNNKQSALVELSRIEKLLSDEKVVARLPDKGLKLKKRADVLRNEQNALTEPSTGEGNPDSANKITEEIEDEKTRHAIQMDIAEKHKNDRVNIAARFYQQYRGILSKGEIEAMIDDTCGLLPTWSETQEMLQKQRQAERRRELEKLREATAPPPKN